MDGFLISSFPRVYRESSVWDKYSNLSELGRGTYGRVFEACNEFTGDRVAVKEIKLLNKQESIPLLGVREISALQALAGHPCIVKLEEAMLDRDRFFLVLELLDCNLHQLLHGLDGRSVSGAVFTHFAFQLTSAVAFMHSRRILARDLKPANILVDLNRGRLKLADFGLSRFQLDAVANGLLTLEVASLWYRPVEVLLGSATYGEGIDLWALGCLIAELYSGAALFAASDEAATCVKIFALLGHPSLMESAHWPDYEALPALPVEKIAKDAAIDRLSAKAPAVGVEVHQTVLSLMHFDHTARVRAKTILKTAVWLRDVDVDFTLSAAFRCPQWDSVLRRLKETRTLSRQMSSDDDCSSVDCFLLCSLHVFLSYQLFTVY